MAHESRKDIEQALGELGWEVRTDDKGPDAVMGGYDKYHLMVSFEGGGPNSVIISYVGRGGGILSRKWPGGSACHPPKSCVHSPKEGAAPRVGCPSQMSLGSARQLRFGVSVLFRGFEAEVFGRVFRVSEQQHLVVEAHIRP
jgi:hypothetical protein